MFALINLSFTDNPPVIVDVDHARSAVQPTMWGIFFEDINMGADGGIYAELIKNRSFEFFNPKMGWKVKAMSKDSSAFVILNRSAQFDANPRFARVTVTPEMSSYCLSNSGFRGIGITEKESYIFSLMALVPDNGLMNMRIELADAKGVVIGSTFLKISGNEWKEYSATLVATKTDPHASINIWFENKGSVDIDMVSLFPADTWKGRPKGLRKDLVQLLADMKPGFLRFPGGCIVEGRDLANRYQWKTTIGNTGERKTIVNRWNTEFAHRQTPDYFQSFGLGFYEYFQLAEDLGAEPLPILNCGMACQFNTAEVVPMDQLDPYIQDALDLIEFANGSAESEWGKIRSEMGHPEPFHLKLLGIGNEQWGPQYFERLRIFEKIITEKFPGITLILGAGPSADGDLFEFAWDQLEQYKPQVVDEHYYKNPAWFLENAGRYDTYSRNSHKIFAGEYAAQSDYTTSPSNQNSWQCALAEAAFMTGLERNADVVTMCSYAPLLAHIDGWQWKPDLIWFDNLKSFGSANYYVQQLFSVNKGTDVINILEDGKPLIGQKGLYASAVVDARLKEIIIKIVNSTAKEISQEIQLQTGKKLFPKGKVIVLQNDQPEACNTIDAQVIKPIEQDISFKGKKLTKAFNPFSVNVIKIKYQ